MQKKAAIITAAVLIAGAAFLYHMGCGISLFAKVKTSDGTGTHSEADIREAVSLARSGFRDFEGCFMTKLSYSEVLSQDEMHNYHGKDVDDIIVLDSDFTTSKVFSEPTFDGRTQRGWKWIITHTEAEGWKLAGSGYA